MLLNWACLLQTTVQYDLFFNAPFRLLLNALFSKAEYLIAH